MGWKPGEIYVSQCFPFSKKGGLTLPHDDVTVFFAGVFPCSSSSAKPHVLQVNKTKPL